MNINSETTHLRVRVYKSIVVVCCPVHRPNPIIPCNRTFYLVVCNSIMFFFQRNLFAAAPDVRQFRNPYAFHRPTVGSTKIWHCIAQQTIEDCLLVRVKPTGNCTALKGSLTPQHGLARSRGGGRECDDQGRRLHAVRRLSHTFIMGHSISCCNLKETRATRAGPGCGR
jgi:hypothetical protein